MALTRELVTEMLPDPSWYEGEGREVKTTSGQTLRILISDVIGKGSFGVVVRAKVQKVDAKPPQHEAGGDASSGGEAEKDHVLADAAGGNASGRAVEGDEDAGGDLGSNADKEDVEHNASAGKKDREADEEGDKHKDEEQDPYWCEGGKDKEDPTYNWCEDEDDEDPYKHAVAIKIVKQKSSTTSSESKFFRREWKRRQAAGSQFLETSMELHAIMGLNVASSALPDGFAMLAMKQNQDNSLASLNVGRRLTEAEIAGVFAQIARGVEYMHGKGIAHRGLKPQSVIFGSSMISGRLYSADRPTLPILNLRKKLEPDCSEPSVPSSAWPGHGLPALHLIRVQVSHFGLTRPTAQDALLQGGSSSAFADTSVDVYALGMLFRDLFFLHVSSAKKRPESLDVANVSERASTLFRNMVNTTPKKSCDVGQIVRDPFLVGGRNEVTAIDIAIMTNADHPRWRGEEWRGPISSGWMATACPYFSDKTLSEFLQNAREDFRREVTKLDKGNLNRLMVELCVKWEDYGSVRRKRTSIEECLEEAEKCWSTSNDSDLCSRTLFSRKRPRAESGPDSEMEEEEEDSESSWIDNYARAEIERRG